MWLTNVDFTRRTNITSANDYKLFNKHFIHLLFHVFRFPVSILKYAQYDKEFDFLTNDIVLNVYYIRIF